MPADRDDPDHDRRLGDHTHRNGFDAAIIDVAADADEQGEQAGSDAA